LTWGEAVPTQIVYNYAMIDPAGRQVINTVVPWGTPLPTAGTPPQLAAVFTDGRTVLTDLFPGPVVKRPVLAMGVPVRIGSEIRYSLNVGLDPAALDVIMRRFPMRDDWVLVILDRQATILARSRAADEFVGQKAVPDGVEQELRQVLTACATAAWSPSLGATSSGCRCRPCATGRRMNSRRG